MPAVTRSLMRALSNSASPAMMVNTSLPCLEMYREGIINVQRVAEVVNQWDDPNYSARHLR
jgi:hypothetical protein